MTIAAVVAVMVLPAAWNGYPLLQYDTGGYLARWYEGYLVPSRSTVYGLYLHLGESSHFWINVVAQSLLTAWMLRLTLRRLDLPRASQLAAVVALLLATTALPFLSSLLLTDIFAGLAVLAVYLLAFHDRALTRFEKWTLFAVSAFAGASHSATLAVLTGLCAAGWIALPFLRAHVSLGGLTRASASLVAAAAMLLAANFALSKQLAWTPGGYGILFGRMLQDGIVKRYLDDHCPTTAYKLCPYRAELPPTADDFLWGKSMFNTLGRFTGLGEEMRAIAIGALRDYPAMQAETALRATVQQLVMVKTGEGTHNLLWHTYGIMERFLPGEVAAMRAARQQRGVFDFSVANAIHVPAAFASLAALLAALGLAAWRRRADAFTLFAATMALAYLGNAFVCGAMSGPHDRYGARIAWIVTFAVLIALVKWATAAAEAEEPDADPLPKRVRL